MDAAVARRSICRAISACSVVMTLFATSGRSSSATSSPSMAHQRSRWPESAGPGGNASLNERYRRSVEVGTLNIGLSCQNADVLPQRLLFDHGAEAFGDVVPHHVEWQPLSRNALIDRHDVESVTGLDQLPQQAGRPQSEDRLLELGHRVAAADLSQIAPVLAGGAVRH